MKDKVQAKALTDVQMNPNLQKKKVLLHACCAVCMAYPVQALAEAGFEPVVRFYNPNIFPEEEYLRRRDELIRYCEEKSYEYIIGDFDPEKWRIYVSGLENEPEKGVRCEKCFEFRLDNAAQKAKELGIHCFTTTLTVSPHKVSRQVFAAGNAASQKYGVEFLQIDFKKRDGFLKTMKLAKENNFYRQQYCGCEFSMPSD